MDAVLAARRGLKEKRGRAVRGRVGRWRRGGGQKRIDGWREEGNELAGQRGDVQWATAHLTPSATSFHSESHRWRGDTHT